MTAGRGFRDLREQALRQNMRFSMSNVDPKSFTQSALGRYGYAQAQTNQAAIDQGLRSYMLGIYNHMTIGLAISALVSLGMFMLSTQATPDGAAAKIGSSIFLTPFGAAVYASPLKWVVMLAPLAFIFFFSFRFERMSYSALLGTFWAFAAVMGVSLGSIFLVFQMGSIVQIFFVTAAAFAGLSLFGYTTKKDLTGVGKFCVMGLIGLVVASLGALLMSSVFGIKSSGFQFALNCIGVLVFSGLTAWDTQRLKEEYFYVMGDATMAAKASLSGALNLYLNFINMFQSLLSIFGTRND